MTKYSTGAQPPKWVKQNMTAAEMAAARKENPVQVIRTQRSLTELTAREYAETMHHGWGEFSEREHLGFTLYFHPGTRYRVICEQHSQPASDTIAWKRWQKLA